MDSNGTAREPVHRPGTSFMKPSPLLFAPLALALAGGAFAADASLPYAQDFQAAPVEKLPEEFMVMSGAFVVKQDGANKFLELPGAPLDTFGLLFGPTPAEPTGASASGRFFGTKQGRKFPTFGVSLNGVGGYRLQVSPGKKALEIYRGDEAKGSVPFEWQSGTWTRLRIQVRKAGAGWVVEGKAWADGAPEPAKSTIAFEDKEEPPAGRAGIWGSPYAGTAIRFDDLAVTAAK